MIYDIQPGGSNDIWIDTMSCRVVSCHVMSRHDTSRHVTSHRYFAMQPGVSNDILYDITSHHTSHYITSHHITSCCKQHSTGWLEQNINQSLSLQKNPKIAHPGEPWGVYCADLRENWPWYSETSWYLIASWVWRDAMGLLPDAQNCGLRMRR